MPAPNSKAACWAATLRAGLVSPVEGGCSVRWSLRTRRGEAVLTPGPFLTPHQSWLETFAAEAAGGISLRALPWVPSPSCQASPPHRRRSGAVGEGRCVREGGAGGSAGSPQGTVRLACGSLRCRGLPLAGRCSASRARHARAQKCRLVTGLRLLLWPRPKPARSPGPWPPNNLLSSANTGKSRLRVPKIPRSPTNHGPPPYGVESAFSRSSLWKRGVSHTISLPPALLLRCGPPGDAAVPREATQSGSSSGHLPSVSFDVVPKEP